MGKSADAISESVSALRSIAYQIDGLSMAFERTGNQTVADELAGFAGVVSERAQSIHDAYFEERMTETDQSIANGQRFIGSILKGLLAGKEPKDACIEAMPHHFDKDLIEQREAKSA